MTYTVWRWDGHSWGGPDAATPQEWEGYFWCAMVSREYGYASLRDGTGQHVYAVFCSGNRIWHTLETAS